MAATPSSTAEVAATSSSAGSYPPPLGVQVPILQTQMFDDHPRFYRLYEVLKKEQVIVFGIKLHLNPNSPAFGKEDDTEAPPFCINILIKSYHTIRGTLESLPESLSKLSIKIPRSGSKDVVGYYHSRYLNLKELLVDSNCILLLQFDEATSELVNGKNPDACLRFEAATEDRVLFITTGDDAPRDEASMQFMLRGLFKRGKYMKMSAFTRKALDGWVNVADL